MTAYTYSGSFPSSPQTNDTLVINDVEYTYTSKGSWAVTGGGILEGTSVRSTGETGAVKFLREDGDGTSSWQAPPGGETLAQTLTIGNTVTAAGKIQFRDTGIYINSSVDGQLDIVADTEIQIATTTIDINGIAKFKSVSRFLYGTVGGPGIAFNGDSNTGFYRIASDHIGISTGGVKRFDINSTGATFASDVTTDGRFVGKGAVGTVAASTGVFTGRSTGGGTMGGSGSSKDISILNKNNAQCITVPTGTNTVEMHGAVDMASTLQVDGDVTIDKTLFVGGSDTANVTAIFQSTDSIAAIGFADNASTSTTHNQIGTTGDEVFIKAGATEVATFHATNGTTFTKGVNLGSATVEAANFLYFGKRVTSNEGNLPFITQASDILSGDGNDLALGAHSGDGGISFWTGASSGSTPFTSSNDMRMSINAAGLVNIYGALTVGGTIELPHGTVLSSANNYISSLAFAGTTARLRMLTDDTTLRGALYASAAGVGLLSQTGVAVLMVQGSAATFAGNATFAGTITGNGSGLTALNGSNISSGTIAAARVATLNQNTTGNAGSATQGYITNNAPTDTTMHVFLTGNSGTGVNTNFQTHASTLTYNATSGKLNATSFGGSGASLTALNGSNISTGTVAAARIPTLNQNTTGASGSITAVDTRAAARAPNDYADRAATVEFTNDFPTLGAWGSAITIKGWADGYNSWQLMGNAANNTTDQNLYYRHGLATSWTTLAKIWSDANFTAGTGATNWCAGNDSRLATQTTVTGSSGSCTGNAATVTNGVYTTGNQTIGGVKTFSASGGIITPLLTSTNAPTRDKIRVWSSSAYTIGMDNGITFGAINNEYAMTFQMNNASGRGFWWGDEAHTDAQGAMSLSTDGKLTVATGARIGYGQSDTTIPSAGLQVSGAVTATGGFISAGSYTSTGASNVMNTAYGSISLGPMNSSYGHIYTDRANFYFNKSYLYAAGSLMWHAGNDGAGSTLDADLLDGVQGADYARKAGTDNLLINNATPTIYFQDNGHNSAMLHCNSDLLYILRGGDNSTTWTQVNGQWPFYISLANNNANFGGNVVAAGNVTAYSDRKLKDNLEVIPNALAKVSTLTGYTYDRIDVDGSRQSGLIAQDVQKVLPEVINTDVHPDTKEETLTVAYGNMVGLLVESIKELNTKVDDLQKQLESK